MEVMGGSLPAATVIKQSFRAVQTWTESGEAGELVNVEDEEPTPPRDDAGYETSAKEEDRTQRRLYRRVFAAGRRVGRSGGEYLAVAIRLGAAIGGGRGG